MARIRTIKPEFWDSPSTARASLRARLLFIAMWNWADDYGVGTASPKALVGFAFPNDDDVSASDFPTLRKEVADCFGVAFYEVSGRPYYAILSWDKHQRTERKAKRTHPEPPQEISAVGSSDDTHGTSYASDGGSGVGTGEQGNRGKEEHTSSELDEPEPLALVPPPPKRDPEKDFERFWAAYPRKEAKQDAHRRFLRIARDVDPDKLIAAAERYRARGLEHKYQAMPNTWLNQGRWEDQTPAASDDHSNAIWNA